MLRYEAIHRVLDRIAMTIALDLDGTLLTCEPRHCAVARYALAATSGDMETEFNAGYFWGLKRRGQSTFSALSQLGHASAMVSADIWCDEIEKPFWLGFDSLLPGVEQVLSMLKSDGASLALVSARTDVHAARDQIRNIGILDFFDYVNFVPSRYASQGKARALSEIGAKIYIGDSEVDYASASLVNIECRLVDTGMRSREFLGRHTSTSVFSSLEEIFKDGSFT